MPALRRMSSTAMLLAALSTTAITTSGCTSRPYSSPQEAAQNACQALGPKALSGALIGGLGGGALGAGVGAAAGGGRGAAIGAGVGLLTGLVGGLIVGSQADKRDCAAAQQALAQLATQPTGVPASWRSPSGSYGAITPVSAEYSEGPKVCRQVRESTNIVGHQPTQSSGITCRDPNGDYSEVTETAANTSGTGVN